MPKESQDLPKMGTVTVPLLPMPNLVLFPNVLQTLHICEPRYRQMTGDALKNDKLLATALLQPGWEADYETDMAVAEIVCLSRIITYTEATGGGVNILLLGLRRARVLRELELDRPYRVMELQLLEDSLPHESTHQRTNLRNELIVSFRQYLPLARASREQMEQLMSSELPLSTLVDIVAFSMAMDMSTKQQLLEQLDVARRASMLLDRIDSMQRIPLGGSHEFPPDFSFN